jgi:hypothetical protein
MARLAATLFEQQAEAARLDSLIAANLKELGFIAANGLEAKKP